MSGRQQAAERTVSALSEQTRALEADTSRRLREQASEMSRQLADTAGQLRAETSAALARQQQAWRAELTAERDRQRAELAQLRADIRRGERASVRAAETWLNDAGLVRDLIRDELPHERYAPGELAAIDRRHERTNGAPARQLVVIAAGYPDERLYVSHRTVQTHLSHVFTKLDITSRAQLAAEVTRHRDSKPTDLPQP